MIEINSAVVSPGESVPWARHYVKELRQRVDKVDDLWDEKEQHSLAEMAQDAYHGKRHPGKITKCISNKHR